MRVRQPGLRRLTGALVVGLIVVLGVWPSAAMAQQGVQVTRQGRTLTVTTPHYRAQIDAANGGRIVSLVVDGVETTALGASGHGGLIEETHTADFAYRIVDEETEPDRYALTLATDAGPLRVLKRYDFRADRPHFAVHLAFENRSRFPLAGAQAPALRNLALPGGQRAAGRELYCLDRGRGAEALSAELFMARMAPDPTQVLRWVAACDLASRRSLGFALGDGGCRPLLPVRVGGGIAFGWAYPEVPAGSRLSSTVLVVPLRGFAALSELNGCFAAESLPVPSAEPFAAELTLMPLADPLEGVTVVTRTYGADGTELDPCDTLVFDSLPALQAVSDDVVCHSEGQPAWLLHEVYSGGLRQGSFAVGVGPGAGAAPVAPEPPSDPVTTTLDDWTAPAPGSAVPVSAEAQARGFLAWRFVGPPAGSELAGIALVLPEGGKRTLFLGVRALKRLERLRFSVAAGETAGEVRPIPPAAVYAWHVSGDDPALLTPPQPLTLMADETAWLALTVDAVRLEPARYAAELIADAEGPVLRVPVSLDVLRIPQARSSRFDLWYVGGLPDAPQPAGRLAAYGVSAWTAPVAAGGDSLERRRAIQSADRTGLSLLSFGRPGWVLPPGGPRAGGVLLAEPKPAWLLRADGASVAAARATERSGYAPALLCERLELPEGALPPDGMAFPIWLVRDGCEVGRVPELVSSGVMQGSESVWAYLDLNGMDWRQAVTEVRSAFWTAAWQGLAGVAVDCPPPALEVDRQLALWHVLRDARQEVALWRLAWEVCAAAPGEGGATLPRVAALTGVVGSAEGCDLRVGPRRVPFRTLQRIMRGDGGCLPTVADFESAARKSLAILTGAPPLAGGVDLHWRDLPLERDGQIRWSIVAPEGEEAWGKALELQGALQEISGHAVPLSRSLPAGPAAPGSADGSLIWMLTNGEASPDWPAAVAEAHERLGDWPVATANLEGGATVVLLGEQFAPASLMRALRPGPRLFPIAGHVR